MKNFELDSATGKMVRKTPVSNGNGSDRVGIWYGVSGTTKAAIHECAAFDGVDVGDAKTAREYYRDVLQDSVERWLAARKQQIATITAKGEAEAKAAVEAVKELEVAPEAQAPSKNQRQPLKDLRDLARVS